MQMQLCSIIIPIYKEILSDTENISLRRCLLILGKYRICFVTFKQLNTSAYTKICNLYNIKPSFEYFSKKYFLNGLHGYNQLLLTNQFYKRFLQFTYILIYQLDAYVFRDELEYWCKMNYSFIGSPIFKGNRNCNKYSAYSGCMNGGLSLRKTKDVYSLLNRNIIIEIFEKKYEKGNIIQKIIAIFQIITIYFRNSYLKEFWYNEDALFSKYMLERWNNFIIRPKRWSCIFKGNNTQYNLPNFNDTFRFSFDENIEYLMELTNNKLPTFCHAFQLDYKRNFWRRYISFNNNKSCL